MLESVCQCSDWYTLHRHAEKGELIKLGSDRSVDEKIDSIEEDLANIAKTLEFIKATMVKADTTIATIAGEVKPTLDALTTNPMVKMFLNKGKDK